MALRWTTYGLMEDGSVFSLGLVRLERVSDIGES